MDDIKKSVAMKTKIFFAIDKPIEKITVSEICEKVDISRQTFYNNFETKYDIIPWWGMWCDTFFVDEIGRKYTWEEGYLRGSFLFRCGQVPLEKGLAGGSKELLEFAAYPVAQYRIKVIVDVLENHLKCGMNDELAFCIKAFAQFESEIIIDGFRRQRSTGLESVKRILLVVPPLLYGALQLPTASGDQLTNYRTVESRFSEIGRENHALDVLSRIVGLH